MSEVTTKSRCEVAPAPPVVSCCSPAPQEALPESPRANWKDYIPLLVILIISGLVSGALLLALSPTDGYLLTFMRCFMGVFLVIFSMFKFFDLPGFAKGFALYDLAAGQFKFYGYAYPFLELSFGLALLANWQIRYVNMGLAFLMFFGALGVFKALGEAKNLRCACLGSTLNVPLSTVAVVEDLGMGVMALVMLGMLPPS